MLVNLPCAPATRRCTFASCFVASTNCPRRSLRSGKGGLPCLWTIWRNGSALPPEEALAKFNQYVGKTPQPPQWISQPRKATREPTAC